jgi:Type II secretion system (T2SS), protein M subtype b
MRLWKRILVEKRIVVVPLLLAILINIGVYALVVYPLGVKSATAADRAEAAKAALNAADADYNAAKALVTGKSRAEQELSTFYDEVVPPDLSAARRMTYAALPRLARKSNVKYEQARYAPDSAIAKDARLGRLIISLVLQGEYESFRQFLYELESAPEFVIVDHVTLGQNDLGKPLVVTLELSTYYRLGNYGN